MSSAHHSSRSPIRDWRIWLLAVVAWAAPALYITTQQWFELRDSPKDMTWLEALAFQGPSWLLLIPATPFLFAIVTARPLQWSNPIRFFWHLLASAIFGVLFLVVAVPTRNLVHPHPFQWQFFGEALYKSVPQFTIMGALAYWGIAIVGSLLETRGRLYATLAIEPDHDTATQSTADVPTDHATPTSAQQTSGGVLLTTASGTLRLNTGEIIWIEAASTGAWLNLNDDRILIRHRLAELEQKLQPLGIVRIHRSYLVNLSRVREVTGAPTRDGLIRLDTGQTLPVTRRRRQHVDDALAASR